MSTAIWWIRRDLRLGDNQALVAALAHARSVVPLFILDQRLLASPYAGSKRIAFLFDGLRALDQDLRQIGSRLILRKGEPAAQLSRLVAETGATAVFTEEDISPFARRRDTQVQDYLPLRLTPGLSVHPLDLVLKKDGSPYTVYTPFSKAWKALPYPQTTDLLPSAASIDTPTDLSSLSIPDEPALSAGVPFPAGEAEAQRRLEQFTAGENAAVYRYSEQRNRPDIAGTSTLSPYLRFGMLSLRQAVVFAYQAIDQARDKVSRKGAETWLNELIWREFYLSILYHFPHVRRGSFRPQYDAIQWANDADAFKAWCSGRTGYPIVAS